MNDLILSCLSQNRDGRPKDGADTIVRFNEARSAKNLPVETETTEIGPLSATQPRDHIPGESANEIADPESPRTQQRSVGREAQAQTAAVWKEAQSRGSHDLPRKDSRRGTDKTGNLTLDRFLAKAVILAVMGGVGVAFLYSCLGD